MNEINETANTLLDKDALIIEKLNNNLNENQIKKYKKIRLLGKGGFAHCYEIFDEEYHQSLAGKIIPKTNLIKSRAKQKLISEIKIHKSIHHENIVKFEHYFEDNDNVYILMELCTNQTMHELLKRRKNLTELEVQYYIFQLIKALKYLHQLKIIHRDLKLANLFLSDTLQLKLGDFGLATKIEFEGERKRSLCGTPNYIAPEILDGKRGHSFEVDIWSLGVIIYILLIGKPPFETNNKKETYKRIRLKNYSFPQNAKISQPAKELIQNILVLEPHKRPTLDEILQSDFMNMGTSIPKVMPQSTLACPPNVNFIKQYMPDSGPDGIIHNFVSKKPKKKIRLEDFSSQFITLPSNNGIFSNTVLGSISNDSNLKRKYIYKPPNLILTNNSDIFMRKWAEAEKFGLGYILSDGNVGVYFNDNTKMLYKPNGKNFAFIDNNEKITFYLFGRELSKELNKKIVLLKTFKGYLFEETKDTKELNIEEGINEKHFIYLKRFVKTKHAILFRLSNKTVQISFHDNTEIILSQENKTVTYINKKGLKFLYPLSKALENDNKEMTKRLRYTKKILLLMITSKGLNFSNIHKVI
jgi:polo-like kinase 1